MIKCLCVQPKVLKVKLGSSKKTSTYSLLSIIKILAASLVFGLVVFYLFVIQQLNEDFKSVLITKIRTHSHEIQASMREAIEGSVHDLTDLSRSEAASKGDFVRLRLESFEVLAKNKQYQSISLVDPKGIFCFNTEIPEDGLICNSHPDEYAQKAMATGRAILSGPSIAKNSHRAGIFLSTSFRTPSGAEFVLQAELKAEHFTDLFALIALSKKIEISVLNVDGNLITTSEKKKHNYAEFVKDDLGEIPNFGKFSENNYHPIETVSSIYIIEPVVQLDYILVFRIDKKKVFQSFLYEEKYLLLSGLSLVIFISLIFVFIIKELIFEFAALEDLASQSEKKSVASALPRSFELSYVCEKIKDFQENRIQLVSELSNIENLYSKIRDFYQNSPCGFHSLDPDGVVKSINMTELKWLGFEEHDVVGKPLINLLTEQSKLKFKKIFPEFLKIGNLSDFEVTFIRRDGSEFPAAISATLIRDLKGNPVLSRGVVIDMTKQKEIETRLLTLSLTDSLTGLSNRRHFVDMASKKINEVKQFGTTATVAVFDIDNFKKINDEKGHAVGDLVLKSIGDSVYAFLRSEDICARVGGDEFAVILTNVDVTDALSVMERLRISIESLPIFYNSTSFLKVTVSFGLISVLNSDNNVNDLISRADEALYQSKRLGKNRISIKRHSAIS